MLFAVTWAADICAFAVGNALKGPKLWPRFSPNKTWSGFFGGLSGAMRPPRWRSAALLDASLSLAGAALIGLAGGLATMAGDLWESMLKRRFGVKDSGDLIPGHGGLLDRVDGLMFAVAGRSPARADRPLVGLGALMAAAHGHASWARPARSGSRRSTCWPGRRTVADVEILALTGGRNVALLAEQALRWRPQLVVIEDESLLPRAARAAGRLRHRRGGRRGGDRRGRRAWAPTG